MTPRRRTTHEPGGRGREGAHVPVSRAAKAMPAIGVIAGAGTNAHALRDVAKQSIRYAQTVLLCERHRVPLPARLWDADVDDYEDA